MKTTTKYIALFAACFFSLCSCADSSVSELLYASHGAMGLSLSKSSIEVDAHSQNVSVSVNASYGFDWRFENIPSWITVTPKSGGSSWTANVRIEFSRNDGTERSDTLKLYSMMSGYIPLSVKQTAAPEPEYVDLGLSVNWATFNVGAMEPEEYGDYYAWGETIPKTSFGWNNYKFRKSGSTDDDINLSKYVTRSQFGNVDDKRVLDLEDDAARVNWGGQWRMPTIYEFLELESECTWNRSVQNGVNGFLVTSKRTGYTGRSIFLPDNGWYRDMAKLEDAGSEINYWSSSMYGSKNTFAFSYVSYEDDNAYEAAIPRYVGMSVRPVFTSDKWLSNTTIKFNSDSKTMYVGGRSLVSAKVLSNNEELQYLIEKYESDNTSVVTVSNGYVYAVAPGIAHITASITKGQVVISGQCTINVIEEPETEHNYVDLGLSVNWATANLNAMSPNDYGGYYAWGETKPKTYFSWDNYKFRTSGDNYDNVKLSKYVTDSRYGTADDKVVLDLDDDAAYVQWGEGWRIPTEKELKELLDNCKWDITSFEGVNGYRITSNIPGYADRSIFVPSERYLSSTLFVDNSSRNMYLYSYDNPSVNHYGRYFSYAVRPVRSSESWLASVSIEIEEKLFLYPGETQQLTSIVKHDNSVCSYQVSWSSDNLEVASVNQEGVVTAISVGTAVITASIQSVTAQCVVTVEQVINGHEYVDLGLSVKWATCNIGATKPEEYGDYFAWGETETKYSSTWTNYKFRASGDSYDNIIFSKYVTSSSYGTVDYKNTLESSDDVAHVRWGGSWRMPTMTEMQELRTNCTWVWTEINGVNGYLVISKKFGYANSIFLPAAGYRLNSELMNNGDYGYYWSSSLVLKYPYLSFCLGFSSSGMDEYEYYRIDAHPVRSVCP